MACHPNSDPDSASADRAENGVEHMMGKCCIRAILTHCHRHAADRGHLLVIRYATVAGDQQSILGSLSWSCATLHQRIKLDAGLVFCDFELVCGGLRLPRDCNIRVPFTVFQQVVTIVITFIEDSDSNGYSQTQTRESDFYRRLRLRLLL